MRFWSRNVGGAHQIGMPRTASKYSAPLLRYRTERVECLLDRACTAEKVDRASWAVAGGVREMHLKHGVTAGPSSMLTEAAAADHCTQQLAAAPPKVRVPRAAGARAGRRRAAQQRVALVAWPTSDNLSPQSPCETARSARASLATAAKQHGSLLHSTFPSHTMDFLQCNTAI